MRGDDVKVADQNEASGVGSVGRLGLAWALLWMARKTLGGEPADAGAAPGPVSRSLPRQTPARTGAKTNDAKTNPVQAESSGLRDSREITGPDDISKRGWKAILWALWGEIGKDRVLAVAAGVTFYILLAIFPAITALVSTYGLFADPATIQQNLSAMSSFIPGGALDVVGGQIQRINSQGSGALGFAFLAGVATSLWSANAGVKALFDALNVAYGEMETRGFFALNLTSLAFTAGMILFAAMAVGAAVVAPIVLSYVAPSGIATTLITWLRWPVLFACIVLALALLYRYGPTRKRPRWQWISVGSAFASVTWVAASAAFSWYAANFGTYNETYGTLGAVIGFLTWVWISVIVVMIGAELNSLTEARAKGNLTKSNEPK